MNFNTKPKVKLTGCIISAIIFLLISAIAPIWAQVPVSITHTLQPNGVSASITSSTSSDACMSYVNQAANAGKTHNYTITLTGISNPTYLWSIKGGAYISAGSNTPTVSVVPRIVNNQFNKARVILDYSGYVTQYVPVICNGSPTTAPAQILVKGQLYFDLYQKFSYTETISGEKCVDINKDYTFSIRDIVSGNLLAEIGSDDYTWSLSGTNGVSPTYATLKSSSEDNRSVTLAFNSTPLPANKQISVKPGKCNSTVIVHSFNNRVNTVAPTPVITGYPSGTCIPSSVSQITLTNTVTAGITYRWELSNSDFSFATGSTSASQSGITVNIGKEAGNILLYYKPAQGSTFCSGSSSGEEFVVVPIKRSLDNSISITGSSCVNQGISNTYNLTADINDNINWTAPSGWTVDNTTLPVKIIAGANAVNGLLKASSAGCPATQISMGINIKPAFTGQITGSTRCIAYGNTTDIQLSIAPVAFATGYSWDIPEGWVIKSGANTPSVTLTPDGIHEGVISVFATGCSNSNSSYYFINVSPATPEAITRVPSTCLPKGKSSVVTFSVPDVYGVAFYEWTVPSGFGTIVSPPTWNTIDVQTTGLGGPYTISVKATDSCGTSGTRTLSVNFDGNGSYSIVKSDIFYNSVKVGERLEIPVINTNSKYTWYKNNDFSTPVTTGRVLDLYDSESLYNNEYCAEITNKTTFCTTRVCEFSRYNSARVSGQLSTLTEISPNPASSQIKIRIPVKFEEAQVRIINSLGITVYNNAIGQEEFLADVSGLSEGWYIMIIEADGNSFSKQIQILR